MGQTGVGKSSLLNVLLDKNIPVDHVRPTTRKAETHRINGDNGGILIIHDLPGIGESFITDQSHLEEYKKHFRNSDLVLWAIQADNRSTTFDAQAFDHLLKELGEHDQKQLMSKMTIVLTKTDTLVPSPWIMKYSSPDMVSLMPAEETRIIIEQKQKFFQQRLIQPFGSHIVSQTYNDANFTLDEPPFSYDENIVTYQGLLTKERVEELVRSHREYRKVFERLYDNYWPIPCSARFKYNLPNLMLVIINKLGSDAMQSFKQIARQALETMSLSEARQLCNLLIWHERDARKIFDLEDGLFPDTERDKIFYKKQQHRRLWPFH